MGKKTSVVATAAMAIVSVSLLWTFAGAPAAPGPASASLSSSDAPLPGAQAASVQPLALPAPGADPAPAAAPGARREPQAHVSRPSVVPEVDWARYPGTLNTQVQQALQNRDGVMAADLARKLRECGIAAGQMQPDIIQRRGTATHDPAVLALMDEQLRTYQRVLANCQTVADWRLAQLELLDVAVGQQVIGAAVESFHLGQRRPEVLQGVVRDAIAGDMSSLVPVTYHAPSTFGISKELQRSLRYAFEIAANDPEVATLVRRYVSIAESFSVPLGGEAQPHFNHEGLTDAQRAQAQVTARQLVQRVKAPRDEPAKAG